MCRHIYLLTIVIFSLLPLMVAFGQNVPSITSRPAAIAIAIPSAYSSNSINYVRSWEPNMAINDSSTVSSPSRTISEVKVTTVYIDGLGRPIQTVNKGISTNGKDVVSPILYDAFSRQSFSYLPYVPQNGNTSNDGSFKIDPFRKQQLFYQDGLLNPGMQGESIYYSQNIYDNSPLNRIVKSYAPGNSWAKEGGNRPTQQQYSSNTDQDSVRIWKVNKSNILSIVGTYTTGTLHKTNLIDENGNQTIEYKDTEGHIVLVKTQLSNTPGFAHVSWLCTYYVYDDLSNLRAVIPPLAIEIGMAHEWNINNAANELCFFYEYDSRNRMVIKKFPDAGPVYIVYDVRDRPVFTQDAVQHKQSPMEWSATFYDELDRPVMTGTYKSTITRQALQDIVAKNSTATNPLHKIFLKEILPLTYTYYDNYNYADVQSFQAADISKLEAGDNLHEEPLPATYSVRNNGKTTGSKVKILGTDKWLTTTIYYDEKGRIIQTCANNISSGKDITSTQYDFSGKALSTYVHHTNPSCIATPQTSVLTITNYDVAGRVKSITKRLNDVIGQDKVIVVNTYDELGLIREKRLGVTGEDTQLDSLTYSHNIRGWLQSINKDFVNTTSTSNWFGQDLSFDNGYTNNQYNGNIAGAKWKSRSDGIPRSYGYSYDKINRLTAADFTQQNSGINNWTKDQVDFSVSDLSYDANGNIKTMQQKGLVGITPRVIDDLTYTYQTGSNKLLAVSDTSNTKTASLGDFVNGANTGDDYTYDANGNLTSDNNKGISSIVYNQLNLPTVINITDKGSINYLYDALGNRLQKTVIDTRFSHSKTTITDYNGGVVYRNDTLEYITHEEGRIRPIYQQGAPVNYAYDYFEKDHLGNIRVVLTDQPSSSLYAVTMETASSAKENALFSNVEKTRAEVPVGYPEDKTTDKNGFVAKLNGKADGNKVGPSLILRVMVGDTIRINAKAFYKSLGPQEKTMHSPLANLLIGLSQVMGSQSVIPSLHNNSFLDANPLTNSLHNNTLEQLKEVSSDNINSDRPKAYLNFVLFDDQFKLVDQNSGVRQVQATPDELQHLSIDQMVIAKSGFLSVYPSNETAQDVFFDNIQVALSSGPLLEETHYYPFGLVMAGISATALKGLNYTKNRKNYNGIEYTSDLDLDIYDAQLRNLDPQIGRWNQVDPKTEKMEMWSPYVSNYNNPIRYNDFLGDEPNEDPKDKHKLSNNIRNGTRLAAVGVLVLGGGPADLAADAFAAQVFSAGNTVATGVYIYELIKNEQSSTEISPTIAPAGLPFPITGNLTGNIRDARIAHRLKADKDAKGDVPNENGSNNYDHSTFERDNNGDIYKHEEFTGNRWNPNHQSQKRFDGGRPDGSQGALHKNSETLVDVPTPHVNGKQIPGGVRLPEPSEFPQNNRFLIFGKPITK